jgi:hypothetical protein
MTDALAVLPGHGDDGGTRLLGDCHVVVRHVERLGKGRCRDVLGDEARDEVGPGVEGLEVFDLDMPELFLRTITWTSWAGSPPPT